ncbi:hypothetical protein LSAT2_005479 [Lamellibrachia satsuma]|nr:hypothetical protein LSAT2_005479 [Lamellibrachia satsuma]
MIDGKKAKDDALAALKEEKRKFREKKRAELAARRATFEAMFEEKKEETESRTYDLNKHLVTVTEVAEVDLADKGTHLGLNQDNMAEEEDSEDVAEDSRTNAETGSRKVRRRRKTFTHRFDKHFKLKERIKMRKSGAPKQKKPKRLKRNH